MTLPEKFRARSWLAAGLLVASTLAVYANNFRGPFIFDDIPSIVENPTIRQLWPLTGPLTPPVAGGITVGGRPVLNLSFALNYAMSGLDVWSYHAINLLIHVLAGLTLYGLARRTLVRPPLAEQFGKFAEPLAFVIAGLWLVHPLQVESVTYVVQRAESLMGLFFLVTVYAFTRAADSPHPWRWMAISFLAGLLGVGTKEVAVMAPVLVLLYDRTFLSGSFRAAWQRHRWRHLALAAIWLPLLVLVVKTGGDRGGTMGFGVNSPLLGYWLIQFEALTRYLGLTFWPHPLVFDYGKIAPPGIAAGLLWSLPVLALGILTLWALWRRPVIGFLGAWFFGILAPTSLLPGTLQMIVEHRMYLPLAAVIALVAGAAAPRLGRRGLLAAGALLVLVAGFATWQRNAVYQDEERLWRLTLAQRPENARTYNNLGRYYYLQNRWDDATACFEQSLRLESGVARIHLNLGLAHLRANRPTLAVAPLQEAVRLAPGLFAARLNLGIALAKIDRAEEALPQFAAALRDDPWPEEIHFQWGIALARLGRWPEASAHYAECLQLNPNRAEVQSNWGAALLQMKSIPEAITHFEAAVRLRPANAEMHHNLGVALSLAHRAAEAEAQFAEAARLRALELPR